MVGGLLDIDLERVGVGYLTPNPLVAREIVTGNAHPFPIALESPFQEAHILALQNA
jgi:hypothetical protein